MQSFLESLKLKNPSTPQGWEKLRSFLQNAVTEKEGKPLLHPAKQFLKTWTTRRMRAQSEESLYEPHQANVFKLKKLLPFWRRLYMGSEIEKMVAIVSILAFHTAGRTAEILSLRIEDMTFTQKEEALYIIMPLRTSKSNASKRRRESLSLPVLPTFPVNIKLWLAKLIDGRKQGKLFAAPSLKRGLTTSTVNYYYRKAAAQLDWEECPSGHSMRVSYVIAACEAGVEDSLIISVCRWKSPEMLEIYRSYHLLESEYGAHYLIAARVQQKREEDEGAIPSLPNLANAKIKRPEKRKFDADVVIIEPENQDTSQKLVQTTLKMQPRLVTTAVQTEEFSCEKCRERSPRELVSRIDNEANKVARSCKDFKEAKKKKEERHSEWAI
ncbi:Oidioi.mRNA.OKI2018_I69.YSR.g17195.t1.cds [Oikopleura dioica]|uniref:Oidioi.mRNA.OKI2018_I69.YSR.g17195.t1.cds n=1 Tax=Oikopleura dioica TaxID=34765 RepID=A0ABN7SM75_OIKDI|nr:Oidioi.mRNA.OKI2018_I69.YSR.g17195.t1.cds [Oikopleura dioica]